MSQFQNNKPFLPFNFRLQHFNLSKLKLPSSKFEMHRICVPIVQCLLGLLLVSSLPDEMLQPLTPESFQQYAQKMQSDDMIWLSQNTKLFNFETSDNFTLQGYMVDVTTAKKQSSVLVYCSGWTETTIKYAKFLRRMHNYGFQIFSYDLRGQGFSDPTSWDGGMVTHTTSLEATYVSDLEYFVQHHVIPAAGGKKLVFCANSFSGLIGLSLQLKNRDMFAKVVVLAPCILPNIDLKTKYQIKALRWIGFESSLLIRMNSDPTDWGKPTTHAESRWKEWQTLRSLVPQRLQIAGDIYDLHVRHFRVAIMSCSLFVFLSQAQAWHFWMKC